MKRFLVFALASLLVFSFSSCGNKPSDNESSVASDVSSEMQGIPNEKITPEALKDGNYYLKVQTVSGDEICIREIAAKGVDVYSSIREGDKFEWYYSNGNATFSFDDEAKTYEIYSFSSLSVDLFEGEKIGAGDCVFFDVDCSYIKYKVDDKVSLLHIYRKTDSSWVGFQYMYGDEKAEANIVFEASDNYPSHAVFSIPEDYEYYFEKGENIASMDWS